jgi:hypothetical protein
MTNMTKERVLVSGINRNQTLPEVLDALDATMDPSVVDTMPRGEGEDVELEFFELDYDSTPRELDAEYERRGLKADPFALAKHMADNPASADVRSVACQWDLGEDGEASYAVFHRWDGELSVDVFRGGGRWQCGYRFAGVCK